MRQCIILQIQQQCAFDAQQENLKILFQAFETSQFMINYFGDHLSLFTKQQNFFVNLFCVSILNSTNNAETIFKILVAQLKQYGKSFQDINQNLSIIKIINSQKMSIQSSMNCSTSMKKSTSYDFQNKSLLYYFQDNNINNLQKKLFQACNSTQFIRLSKLNQPTKTLNLNSQLQIFKLRKQENKAELMKIQLELRRRSKFKLKQKSIEKERNIFNQSYAQNYRYFKQEKERQQFNQILNEDQEEDEQNQQNQKQIFQQKIICYNQVKKHPKILDYTIQRINQITGEKHKKQQLNRRSLIIQKIKEKQVSSSLNQYQIPKTNNKLPIQNPQSIIEKQRTKFYVKKNSGTKPKDNNNNLISKSVRQTQQNIIKKLDCQTLSKQTIGKIKGKFNQLINLIQKNDQKHVKQFSLPKIS